MTQTATQKATLQDIKQQKQDKVNQLITDCLVFFAFSNEQFTANKTPLQEGEKYVSMGAGGYMPKGKVSGWLEGMKNIETWYKAAIKENKGMRRQNIAYELANHEAYYTGDITDTLRTLGSNYTKKEVLRVYHEELPKQDF